LRYFVDPFGCVKNQVDAENMMAHLNNAGWESADDAEQADLIIVNSCGFIESAKKESINAVLEWRKIYPGKKILLAGCLAQRYAKELSEELKEADAFMGVEDTAKIVEAAAKVTAVSAVEITAASPGLRPLLSLPGSAYVKISEGCNNNCSYCAIPLIRGNLVCRKIPDIVDECRALLARGIKELCIIGQDIGAHDGLLILLNTLSMLKGDFWVRLLYIHPDHFPLQILDLMEHDKRFLPYFDIPFQHASQKILTAMNRRGTAEKYLELINTIRARCFSKERFPNAVIRSTFLLGFPGETEDDFNALLDFQQKAQLDWLGCFTYSREEGTAAFSMHRQVPAKIAQMRKQTIEERQIPITEKNMERFSGLPLDVLIEEQFISDSEKNEENLWLGRLYCQAPEIDGAAVILSGSDRQLQLGTLVSCKVIARCGFDLEVRV
jgi:ribosomal protein S12 methylthiotransferase